MVCSIMYFEVIFQLLKGTVSFTIALVAKISENRDMNKAGLVRF